MVIFLILVNGVSRFSNKILFEGLEDKFSYKDRARCSWCRRLPAGWRGIRLAKRLLGNMRMSVWVPNTTYKGGQSGSCL